MARRPAYVNIAQAKSRLSELIDRAAVGEDIVIAKDHKPVAKLTALDRPTASRKPGSARGQVWIAPDFDAVPDDFEEHLP